MLVYAYMGMYMHARVLETTKDKIFYIKAKVWSESHIAWKLFQTPFSQYKKPYMVHFQRNAKNLKRKHKIH